MQFKWECYFYLEIYKKKSEMQWIYISVDRRIEYVGVLASHL